MAPRRRTGRNAGAAATLAVLLAAQAGLPAARAEGVAAAGPGAAAVTPPPAITTIPDAPQDPSKDTARQNAPKDATRAGIDVLTPGSDGFKPVTVAPDPADAPKPAAATEPARPDAAPAQPASLPGNAAPAETSPAPAEAAVPALPPPAPGDPVAEVVAARLADPNFTLIRRLNTKQREAMQAFYALGAFKSVWLTETGWSDAAKAVIARLQAAGEDGLDPLAYPIPLLDPPHAKPADRAEADLKLSAAAVLYARDARGGRIEPSRLSRFITPKLDLPSADAVLTRLTPAGSGAGGLLQAYNPGQPGYLALKAKLASLRAQQPNRAVPMVRLPKGPALKTGMRDPRVPLIRARFGLGGATDATAYDEGVATAVASFQRQRGMKASGVLDPATVAALAGPAPDRQEADLLANMERWRWMPTDLGRTHVFVNIPEYKVRVIRDGRVLDEARVIVGKPDSPTPIFSGEMTYAVVNPSWTVPPSILKSQFLPGLARDPNYAARLGYQVVKRGNGIAIRQPPGERNALGFIKFMFPNDHAVYLHDTPNRSLFSRSERALSHGCVRVDDPFRFAQVVLGPRWPTERLKTLIGKGERTVMLPEKLPVHLAYFTLEADGSGPLRSLPDLYGINARVKVALGLSTEALPPEAGHKPKVAGSRPAATPPGHPGAAPRPHRDLAQQQQAAPRQSPRRPVATATEPVEPAAVQPAPDYFGETGAIRRGWW
ncbi:Murein L,D-transpeptidase YcbB/YkuD [Methylobacterium sp. 174MFSha1.1]|uniref:L,D-transpeptidase family protein n=1 Tax=Methylobacterium sp. 174MFSha1.1 TaxID=1502749 RepID=UPI0008E8DA87|nr:L,D-transpeptidase family protein [Methylobacterium sp. 174MFSha1.1]SFU72315.1 Murein L,D-transpeptidase YcbB/YkuD [Methylobacterium sp. 174MFSha1.1]